MERTLTYAALFAALTAALGLMPRIDLVAGVPITAQSLGVMLAGAVLGARRGALAILLFVALLALGLPLLSGGANLWAVLYTPRIGYVVGFPLAAYVTGTEILVSGGGEIPSRHLAAQPKGTGPLA